MAEAQSNTSQTVHSVDGEVEVLRASFTVPSGQKANIAAFFNGEAYKYPNGYCYLKFYLDAIGSGALRPGQLWVADGYVYSGAYPTISAQGYKGSMYRSRHTLGARHSQRDGRRLLHRRPIAHRHFEPVARVTVGGRMPRRFPQEFLIS